MKRTLGVLCDKSTLLQIGQNVRQSTFLRKHLDIGHELVARNAPQWVSQLAICIAIRRRGWRAARREDTMHTHAMTLVRASSLG